MPPYDPNKKSFFGFDRQGDKIYVPTEILEKLLALNRLRGGEKAGVIYMNDEIAKALQEYKKTGFKANESHNWIEITQLREMLFKAYNAGKSVR